MKKLLSVLLAAIMLLSFTACGGGKESNRLEEIKERGYLTICTEPYFAPYEFIDPSKSGDEQYVGMDIEIAKYIADKIGVDLQITPLEFSAVLTGVIDGKYDLALSAMAYSPERAENMNLSKGYYFSNTGYGFICREEDKDKYIDIESLKDAVVITQSGSVQEALYNQYVPECKEFKLVSSMTDAYLAVAENKADVCICSCASAQLYADANGGLFIPEFRFELDESLDGTRVGATKEGTDELMELVNECIDELIESGKIEEWYAYYSDYAKTLGVA